MSQHRAYITIATNKKYLPGVMALHISLRQTGTSIPLYVMLLSDLVRSEDALCSKLKDNGIQIIEYSNSVNLPQQLIDNNKHQGELRFNHTFDKLLVFEQTQFDKIVYIDADMYVLQNLDHLFEKPHMSAVVAGKEYPGNEHWIDLNSGLMVIVPEKGLSQKFSSIIPEVYDRKKWCGDQDILQAYYEEWPNRHELHLGEKYGVFANYAHYYESHLGYVYNDQIDDPKSVAILHFIGETKPWMQQWSLLSVLKQDLHLVTLKLIHKRNTTAAILEYKKLVRKARKLLSH